MLMAHTFAYDSLQKACRKVLSENWTAYSAAKHFDIDRSNMCAYFKGRKQIPIGLMFEILDYHDVKVVCFKRY